MSLHREETFCSKNHEELIGWQAACACGWEGEGHFRIPARDADLAHKDYRNHVEDMLGAEAYYTAPVGCKNCGSRHSQPILIGTPVYQNGCENCGQKFLQPDNAIWDESRASAKLWGL